MAKYRSASNAISNKVPAATHQMTPVPGTVQNNAGGFVYQIDKWEQFDRFLILGSEGGTYYVNEHNLTLENAKNVLSCIQEDGIRAVNTIVQVSESGRAPKNSPALFALAIAASNGDVATKRLALRSLSKIARIGTHLFEFAHYVDGLRGWGYGLRMSFAHWYNDMSPEKLALQVVKYPKRTAEEGNSKSSWSHDDILRKCHAKGDELHNMIYDYVTKEGKLPDRVPDSLKILEGANKLKAATSEKEAAALIEKYELPHELVPKELADSPVVWEALLPHMPITATLRSLNRLTAYGVLKPLSSNLKTVVDRLLNVEQIKKGRVHPISVLSALKTYAQGHGTKGSLSWTPVARINDALNEMLYLAFDQVEPTGKNLLLGFDISGSMDSSFISNLGISAREAAAVMGMVTARAEKNHYAIGFTSSGGYHSRGDYGVTALDISPRDRLDVVVQKMQKMPMGGTDCALAVMHALKNKLDVDGFVVYTDNETYAGSIKVDEALKRYRKEMNKPTAKLIAVGMTATQYSIVDDKDRYCMNVVGFDTAAPAVISDFMRQK